MRLKFFTVPDYIRGTTKTRKEINLISNLFQVRFVTPFSFSVWVGASYKQAARLNYPAV